LQPFESWPPVCVGHILDRDYRSENECAAIKLACENFCDLVTIHHCKEIENFVLVPNAIDRAAERRVADRARRSGSQPPAPFIPFAREFLSAFAQQKRSYILAQYLAFRRAFERQQGSGINEATLSQAILEEFELLWSSSEARIAIVPGKEALSAINAHLQDTFGVNVTPTAIVDAMAAEEIPREMKLHIADLAVFSSQGIQEMD
jgi:hypothetical protein